MLFSSLDDKVKESILESLNNFCSRKSRALIQKSFKHVNPHCYFNIHIYPSFRHSMSSIGRPSHFVVLSSSQFQVPSQTATTDRIAKPKFLNSYSRRHFYVGSANFDWRSITQVKEIGVLALNCPKLAEDMSKIYEVYWALGGPDKTIPDK